MHDGSSHDARFSKGGLNGWCQVARTDYLDSKTRETWVTLRKSSKSVRLNDMILWFSVVIGTWLLLSVVVSLGLARAISLSKRNVRLVPASSQPAVVSFPVIPIQSRRSSDRVLASVNRYSA